ncbi:MAG: aspartate-semialdehyde dehydrogenase [Myxococcota bacterium]
MSAIPVGILGATGMVGQRMIQLLDDHPWFQVAFLGASQRSANKPYDQATTWRFSGEIPGNIASRTVHTCDPAQVPDGVKVVFSALDSAVAREIETAFRDAGFLVVSNASAFRMDPLVPLVIPEVNPDHVDLLERQPGPGAILTNPNCCAIPLALAVAPLHRRWGVEAMTVATWQAVSGAGYPGESAWDMVGSVHPHPGKEEIKLTEEPAKILGTLDGPANFAVSARCVRVPVADGHLLGVHARLRGAPSAEEVAREMAEWTGFGPELPSCPRHPLVLTPRRDRPSPRLDISAGNGMAITVGRVEACPVMGVKFYALGHNTIRGAAGAAISNAELLHSRGLLS